MYNDDYTLCLHKVSKFFGVQDTKQKVLIDIDLMLKKGEIVAIIGQSGVGKSTLLHIAGLLDTPDAGSVYIKGKCYSNMSENTKAIIRRKYIGFVYQFHHLLPEFTVTENLVIPQMIAGVNKAKARVKAQTLLKEVDMVKYSEKFVTELSGGEQQKVAVVRSLVNDPAIILADEPTGNLDSENSLIVLNLLVNAAKKRGNTVVIVTHNLDLATMTDKFFKLEQGSLFLTTHK